MLLVILAVLIVLLIVLPLIGYTIVTLFSVAIVGLVIGGLARLVLPGRQNISVFATILLGWIGSLIGGFVGYRLLHASRFPTVLLEIAVAAVLVALYSGSSRSRSTSWANLPQRQRNGW